MRSIKFLIDNELFENFHNHYFISYQETTYIIYEAIPWLCGLSVYHSVNFFLQCYMILRYDCTISVFFHILYYRDNQNVMIVLQTLRTQSLRPQ